MHSNGLVFSGSSAFSARGMLSLAFRSLHSLPTFWSRSEWRHFPSSRPWGWWTDKKALNHPLKEKEAVEIRNGQRKEVQERKNIPYSSPLSLSMFDFPLSCPVFSGPYPSSRSDFSVSDSWLSSFLSPPSLPAASGFMWLSWSWAVSTEDSGASGTDCSASWITPRYENYELPLRNK